MFVATLVVLIFQIIRLWLLHEDSNRLPRGVHFAWSRDRLFASRPSAFNSRRVWNPNHYQYLAPTVPFVFIFLMHIITDPMYALITHNTSVLRKLQRLATEGRLPEAVEMLSMYCDGPAGDGCIGSFRWNLAVGLADLGRMREAVPHLFLIAQHDKDQDKGFRFMVREKLAELLQVCRCGCGGGGGC